MATKKVDLSGIKKKYEEDKDKKETKREYDFSGLKNNASKNATKNTPKVPTLNTSTLKPTETKSAPKLTSGTVNSNHQSAVYRGNADRDKAKEELYAKAKARKQTYDSLSDSGKAMMDRYDGLTNKQKKTISKYRQSGKGDGTSMINGISLDNWKDMTKAMDYQSNVNQSQNRTQYNADYDTAINLEDKDKKYLNHLIKDVGEGYALDFLKSSPNAQGWEEKYGMSYDQILNAFQNQLKNEQISYGEAHPILSEIGTAIGSIPAAIQGIDSAVFNAIAPNSKLAKETEEARQEYSDTRKRYRTGVKENTGDKGDTVIDTVNAIADRALPTIAGSMLGGAVLSGVGAGGIDANQQMDILNDRPDMSEREKALSALGHGTVEGIGTAITAGILDLPGLRNIGGNATTTAGKALSNMGRSAFNAAVENSISEVIENAMDTAIGGDNSQKEYDKLVALLNGATEEEAEKYAKKNQADRVKMAAITGAGFGGITSGIREVPSLLRGNRPQVYVPDFQNRATSDAITDAIEDNRTITPDITARIMEEAEAQPKTVAELMAEAQAKPVADEDIPIQGKAYSPEELANWDNEPSVPRVTNAEPEIAQNSTIPTANSDTEIGTTPRSGEQKVRSFSNRGSQDEELPDEIRNVLKEDYYKVARNADTKAKAESLFDANNLSQTRSNFEQAVEKKDPASSLLAYKLTRAYVDGGDYDSAIDVMRTVSEKLTEAGQFTQAAKLAMVKNDPYAAARMYIRDLDSLNLWGQKKYKNKWTDLELSQDDLDAFNNIQIGDSEALSSLVDSLNTKFGEQIPATMWDKIVGASKTAMLLNPRTQGRNILANVAALPMRSISDRVSALGQNIAYLFDDSIEKTQSLTGGTKEQKDIAGKIFDDLEPYILGENKMKDSVKGNILSHRRTFNDDFFAKWVDNITNGGIQRLNQKFGADGNKSTMETLSNLTYWLMGDVGDTPFVKMNFVNRLASYMKAQGITNIEDVPDDAIAIATQEALKATFKDDNAFTKLLQNTKKNTGKFGEVALPFTKTPANLTMRAIDYSPIGLINTFRKAKSGADITSVIDDLSKNITGTAMIYLGYKLRESGLLTGNYSDNKREADAQKRQGMLENAFHTDFGDITYDWAQPASTPLMLGSTIYDAINKSDQENATMTDIVNAGIKGSLNVANSILELSPLQSLTDMLGGNQYGDGGVAENIAQEVLEFPQRLIPAFSGATARIVDPIYRDTYSDASSLEGILKNQGDQALSKIPFLSKNLPASYDAWGNERRRSNSTEEAVFSQYINPGTLGIDSSIPIDANIQKIYDATGNESVFPKVVTRSVDLGNDGTKKLTNEQHSKYQKTIGQYSRQFAEGLFADEGFNSLSPDEQAKILSDAYNFADSLSKEQLFGHVTDSDKTLKEAYKQNGVDGVIKYFADRSKASSLGISMETYETKEAEYEGGAAQYVQDRQDALNYGFVQKDGDPDLNNYLKAKEMVGGNSADLEAKSQLVSLGISGTKSAKSYFDAKTRVPELNPDMYAQIYNSIESNGEDGITQTEFKDFLNQGSYTQEQVNLLYNIFGGEWKKVPALDKNGNWTFVNPK